MQHLGKAALRVTKNYTKGYSDTQAKVRDATSNDPWGPSGTQMNEIAQLTYNQGDFIEIMEMLDKRLNDKGKNWRHVFKSLTLLDYCLHQGSENVVIYFQDNLYVIKTLKEFQFIDEEGKDQGANVRQKAKDITNLLTDEGRLREERRSRAHMRDRMLRAANSADEDEDENSHRREVPNGRPNKKPARDEDELKKAIEESKRSLAKEQKDREEKELEDALRMSKEEEEKRKKDVATSNADALFDDAYQLPTPSSSLSSRPFPLVDPTPYATGLQPQYTIQPQLTSIAPHFTSFNLYQQQADQEARQAEYQQMLLLQQHAQQQEEYLRQQQLWQMQQQQQQQQQMQMQMQQQQLHQQSLFTPPPSLQAQATGFGQNNPFAPSFTPLLTPSSQPSLLRQPSFNLQSTYDNHSPANLSSLSSSPQPVSPPPAQSQQVSSGRPINAKVRKDENEALASLFADREVGLDTFGNLGAMRYGYTDAGKQVQQQSLKNHNPFALQTQQRTQSNTERPFFDI